MAKVKRIGYNKYQLLDFEIEKIGKRWAVTMKWEKLQDEVLALTRTKHGAVRFIKKNGKRLMQELWATNYSVYSTDIEQVKGRYF